MAPREIRLCMDVETRLRLPRSLIRRAAVGLEDASSSAPCADGSRGSAPTVNEEHRWSMRCADQAKKHRFVMIRTVPVRPARVPLDDRCRVKLRTFGQARAVQQNARDGRMLDIRAVDCSYGVISSRAPRVG